MSKKVILLLGTLIILAISSSLSYEQTSIISILENYFATKPFEHILSLLHIPYWGRIVSVESEGYFGFVEFLVRKACHFIGFGIIATILYWLLPQTLRWRSSIVVFTVFFIALTDEFRQYFTPGRTMSLQDVLLDTTGAITAIVIINIYKKYATTN